MEKRPVKILQFGEGNFLRAFADCFVDISNEAGDTDWSIAVVKPRGDRLLTQFHAQDCRYTVAVRGVDENGPVEYERQVSAISQAVNPNVEYAAYRAVCLGEELRFVISNTTEAGICFDSADTLAPVPKTFPARVTRLLYDRYVHFGGDREKGLYFLPCELIDNNADKLRAYVLDYARLWRLPEEFITWVEESCWFLNTLVDRIVSGFPKDGGEEYFRKIGWEDKLLTVCEPFGLWVIEEKGNIRREFPLDRANPEVLFAPDVTPYKVRKVRLLNGAHTSTAPLGVLLGKTFVLDIMEDTLPHRFLKDLLTCEVIPSVTELPREDLEEFSDQVLTRFSNPGLNHALGSILLNSVSKAGARILPSITGYYARCGAVPRRLAFAFAALLRLYCTQPPSDSPEVLEFFEAHKMLTAQELVEKALDAPALGFEALKAVPGFGKLTAAYLEDMEQRGTQEALGALLCELVDAAVALHESDNVAVAKRPLFPGEQFDGGVLHVRVRDSIPAGHKAARCPIQKGEPVIKYGYPIGVATEDIPIGGHVHSHCMRSALEGKGEFAYGGSPTEKAQEPSGMFMGYLRPNGQAAVRNEIWVIPTVGCVNETARQLAAAAHARRPAGVDAVVALTHPYGCSQLAEDHANTRTVLAALANHPNAAGVLLLGLGCENNQMSALLPLVDTSADRVRTLICQETEDEVSDGEALLDELMVKAAGNTRQSIGADKLVIGVKCGGSDGFSGITANALVGGFTDLLTAMGGSVVMGEVPEMFGAEQTLLPRCESREVFDAAVAMIDGFKDYYIQSGLPIYENPSPGNMAGGITTLEEKSIGCTQKSGGAVITDVLEYGQRQKKPGLTLLCTPGNDLVSATAMAAAGCHMVLFTTGRGTPFGTCVPTLKISSNSALAQRKRHWIDFDAGSLLERDTMPELSRKLLEQVLETASGTPAANELAGYRQIAIFKNGVTL